MREINSFDDVFKDNNVYLDDNTKILGFHYDIKTGDIYTNIFYPQNGRVYNLQQALKVPFSYITDYNVNTILENFLDGSIPKNYHKSFNLLEKDTILYLIKNDSTIVDILSMEYTYNLLYVLTDTNIVNIIKLDKNDNLIVTKNNEFINKNNDIHKFIKESNSNIFPLNKIDEILEFDTLNDKDIINLLSYNFAIFRPLLFAKNNVKSIVYRRFDDVFKDATIDQVRSELKFIIKEDIKVLADLKNIRYIRTEKLN